jgi:hypothetical protein
VCNDADELIVLVCLATKVDPYGAKPQQSPWLER